jgi:hypothetical protein
MSLALAFLYGFLFVSGGLCAYTLYDAIFTFIERTKAQRKRAKRRR